MSEFAASNSRASRITQILQKALSISHLNVENESHRHQVPINSETHFKLTIISDEFSQLPLLARHRLINQLIAQEFTTGLHALSLHLYTNAEWQKRQETTLKSPACSKSKQKNN
jgi:BolA protein